MKEISIDQLIIEEQYYKLKKDFLLRDDIYVQYIKHMNEDDSPPQVDLNKNDILYMVDGFTTITDELGCTYEIEDGCPKEKKENFYKHCIMPSIKKMFDNYIKLLDIDFFKRDTLNPAFKKDFGNSKSKILSFYTFCI